MIKKLYETVTDINADVKARFCMPGHGGIGLEGDLYACARFDWTEAPGLDNLLQSESVILESEKSIAKSMGYAQTLMLTQGSSCGIHIAVCTSKDRGNTLAVIGEMHKSFWAACRLYGANTIAFASDKELKSFDNSDIKIGGVFVTSPDYFGNCRNLSDARAFADEMGALLVVDEAHASHFCYSSLLPNNARDYADISVMSMHKTMPVYGGGAIVNLRDDSLRPQCEKYRSLIHSTSPNYLTMSSMDCADAYMRKYGERDYKRVKDSIDEFGRLLTIGEIIKNDDFTRLVIRFNDADGDAVLQYLAKRGVYAEMSWEDKVVFIVTPFNCDKLEILAKELAEINISSLNSQIKSDKEFIYTNVRQDENTEFVEIDDALGRISAEDVGAYPPGIPVLFKGDVIDENKLNYLKKYRNRLFGLAQGRVAVIK